MGVAHGLMLLMSQIQVIWCNAELREICHEVIGNFRGVICYDICVILLKLKLVYAHLRPQTTCSANGKLVKELQDIMDRHMLLRCNSRP